MRLQGKIKAVGGLKGKVTAAANNGKLVNLKGKVTRKG